MSKNILKLFSKFGLLLLAIICFLIAIKSSDLLEKKDLHRENFVTISLSKYFNETCEEFDISSEEDTSSEEGQCIPGKFPILDSTASGLIIKKIDGKSYILTADHFCNSNPQNIPGLSNENNLFEDIITLSDHKSRRYSAEMVYHDKAADLCLLRSDIPRDVNTIRFSDMPDIGEKIYTIASPLGISESGILLHFEGFFSGCENTGTCFYTIPATSGSSGSIVFDMNGRAIGIIQMTPVYFRSMSIGVGSSKILIFLNNASKELDIDLI